MAFLPVRRSDMEARDWDSLDFLFVTGDAYVDHPSFGAALLTRLLESEGYRVGVLAQPDPSRPDTFLEMGIPRLAVLVSSGVVDSMVNNYTAARKPRRDDRYSPGGKGGRRPDRALIRYCEAIRAAMGDVPIVVGGLEASLRRFSHDDYWSGWVRRSVLQDSGADLLVFGSGEGPLLEIADRLASGIPVRKLTHLRGTCVLSDVDSLPAAMRAFLDAHSPWETVLGPVPPRADLWRGLPSDDRHVLLPSHREVSADPLARAVAFRAALAEQDPAAGRVLFQWQDRKVLVQNPPAKPLDSRLLDRVYALPYERRAHPAHEAEGGVPALEEVLFSLASHRGCYGGCSFCAISMHQGRLVQPRSAHSILEEARAMTRDPRFKGYIHDVGGPTANFRQPACARQRAGSACAHRRCLVPAPCPELEVDHREYLELLASLRKLPGVRKVFIRSGVRFDVLPLDPHPGEFLEALCAHHVSGQLKVAPEHVSAGVLSRMGKPGPEAYERFCREYERMNRTLGKNQYLVPYFMTGHPGCTLEDAVELALHVRDRRVMPEQVQDFYPTPGTASTIMYFTGYDPYTMERVAVPSPEEKAMQRALVQYGKPENRRLVEAALRRVGRLDLMGPGPEALVRTGGTERKGKRR